MDLFKNGLGMTASAMGDGWCGEALGKGRRRDRSSKVAGSIRS